MFRWTGTGKFPIIIAFYEKNSSGMTFEYIKNFQFDVLNRSKKFVLSKYRTTDGYINKYPPRKNDIRISPIGLYYYTFRDFNSLKKNASFLIQKHPNGIVVLLENFYKYAYLYSLKRLFNPEDAWLYGNLSPLVNIEEVERDKKMYVSYALKTNPIFKKIKKSIIKKIAEFYGVSVESSGPSVEKLENLIKERLNKLV